MTRRAIAAGWQIPEAVRLDLCAQLSQLLGEPLDPADTRAANHRLKLVDLVMVMETRNQLDAGIVSKSEVPWMRWRGAENRRPRARKLLEPKRIATALERYNARQAAANSPVTGAEQSAPSVGGGDRREGA